MIKEGNVKKGGMGKPPSHPRPTGPGVRVEGCTIRVSNKNIIGSGGSQSNRPPTTEWYGEKPKPETMEPVSIFMFFVFMFCAFCLGVAVGGYFGN